MDKWLPDEVTDVYEANKPASEVYNQVQKLK